jgi:phage-related protein
MATSWATVVASLGLEVDQKKTAKTIADAVGKAKAEAELTVDKTKTRKTVEDAVKGAKPEADVRVDERGVTKSVEDAVGSAKAEADVTVDEKGLASSIEDAASSAAPTTDVDVDTAGVAGQIEDAATDASPTSDVDVDTASVAGQIEDAASSANPSSDVDVDTAGVAGQIEQAATDANPTTDVDVDASQVAAAIETAAADAHPVVPVEAELDTEALADSIQGAVEDAMAGMPPITIPVDQVQTSKSVESSVRGADTASAGKEAGGKFASAFGGPLNVLKASVAGAVGAEALMGSQQLFSSMITQAGAANKSMKVLDEAIKTTGGAAGVTAKDIDAMAAAQGRATGVSATSIKQADALLLRFTNIKNAAGANNDVFNRTSQAALDLTAAMNKGVVDGDKLQGTMRLLGKAMEDPTKAAGTLRRYGVELTAQQQEQIKVFAKSGDTLSAQKVVLDAIGQSYGNTAENTASAGAKIGESVRQMTESIGKLLIPILSDLLKIVSTVLKILQPLIDAFTNSGTAASVLRGSVVGVTAAMAGYLAIAGTVKGVQAGIKTATDTAKSAVDAYHKAIDTGKKIIDTYGKTVKTAQGGIAAYQKTVASGGGVVKGFTAALHAMNLAFLTNPVFLVTAAIIALAAAFYLAYTRSETFRNIVNGAFRAVLSAAQAVFGWIKDNWPLLLGILTGPFGLAVALIIKNWDKVKAAGAAVFRAVSDAVTAIWRGMWQAIQQITQIYLAAVTTIIRVQLEIIQGVFRVGVSLFSGIWNAAWEIMVAVVKTFVEYIELILRTFIDIITQVIKAGMALLRGDWEGAWNALAEIPQLIFNNLTEFFRNVTQAWGQAFAEVGAVIADTWSSVWGTIHDTAVGAWQLIYDNAIGPLIGAFKSLPDILGEVAGALSNVWSGVADFFVKSANAITGAWERLPEVFRKVGEGLHSAIKWIVNVPIAGLVKVFNSVGGPIHLPNIPVPHMAARGWRVNEGTTETADDVLVRVSRNETILSARTSREHAAELSAWRVPGYQAGGVPLPGFQFGGLGSLAGDLLGRVTDAAKAATRAAGNAIQGVINGVVWVAHKAVDAGQIAADLAAEKTESLWQGMKDIAEVATTPPGARAGSWVRAVSKEMVARLTQATGKTLGGIAGKAASVLNIFAGGGMITEPVAGIGLRTGQGYRLGEAGAELVVPARALAGGGTLPDLAALIGGQAGGTLPSKTDIQAWLNSQDRLADQLARIGMYLQQNPQQVANAIAQALNGVARLATAGAAWATR